MNLYEIKKGYVFYVDLDGVLANLEQYVEAWTGMTFPELRHSEGDEGFTNFVRRQRAQGHSVFDQLEPMPDAYELWDYVLPYHPNILTATGEPVAPAKAEKIRWVHDELTGFDHIYTVQHGQEKARYAASNHVLIDDTEHCVIPWREAGGIGILHINARETIAQLKKIGL